MELNDKTNKSYLEDREAYKKIEPLKKDLEKLSQELKIVTRQQEDAKIKMIRAKEDKDKKAEKTAKDEVEQTEKRVKELKEKIGKIKKTLEKSQEKVNGYIEKLKEDPEFESHINSILEKKYNRKLEKMIDEKAKFDVFSKVFSEHPALTINLEKMVKTQEEIEKINAEIEKLDTTKDASKIENLKQKIAEQEKVKDTNAEVIMKWCEKHKVNADKEYLYKLVSEKKFAHYKDNKAISEKINVEKSLKNIQKGYDRQIEAYKKAIEKVPGAELSAKNKILTGTIGKNESEKTDDESAKSEPPAKVFKWYEFRKRFADWKERRAARKAKSEEKTAEKMEEKLKESEKFRSAYKYDIVKDYVEQQEKSIYKSAIKEQQKKKEEASEEQQKEDDEQEIG